MPPEFGDVDRKSAVLPGFDFCYRHQMSQITDLVAIAIGSLIFAATIAYIVYALWPALRWVGVVLAIAIGIMVAGWFAVVVAALGWAVVMVAISIVFGDRMATDVVAVATGSVLAILGMKGFRYVLKLLRSDDTSLNKEDLKWSLMAVAILTIFGVALSATGFVSMLNGRG
jgi:hypothetical protein